MLETIINNLELLELPAIAFMFAWLTNFSASIYYNVGIIKEIFEAKRLLDGIVKMMAIGVALASLSICVTVLIEYVVVLKIPIEDGVLDKINTVAIIGIFAKSTIDYAKQGYETIDNIFNPKK